MRAVAFDTSVSKILATLALKRLWSGAVFARTSPVRFVDLPEPDLPGPRWIRVRNRLCGVCASDVHLLTVEVDPKTHIAAVPSYDRYFLGHEVVGEVVEVGDEVTSLAVGARVAMQSRFLGPTCRSQDIEPLCSACVEGNYNLCVNQAAKRGPTGVGGGWGDGYTCHVSEVWPVPDWMTDEQATLIEPLACSLRGVLRRVPEPGQRALVIGCGTIGLGVIQGLRALAPEASVHAVARYPHQADAAQRYGASLMASGDLLERTTEVTDATLYAGELNNRTVVGGFDVVYDCVGSGATLGTALRVTRAGGAVVLVGLNLKRYRKLDVSPVWAQEVTLLGAVTHGTEHWEGQAISTFDLTARLLQEGKLMADGFITHRFPLDEWKKAVRIATDKTSGSIKVVFELDSE